MEHLRVQCVILPPASMGGSGEALVGLSAHFMQQMWLLPAAFTTAVTAVAELQ